MSKKGPVKGTRVQDGRYYLVRAEGKKRIWVPLTRVSEGVPAFYRALAAAKEETPVYTVPLLVADWEREVMTNHAERTQRDERARGRIIAHRFAEFTPEQLLPPDVVEFLKAFKDKPRTHNASSCEPRRIRRQPEWPYPRRPATCSA